MDTITEVACKEYTWLSGTGLTYNTDTIITLNYSTTYSCDSSITLKLTINSSDSSVAVNGLTLTANNSNSSFQWINCNNSSPIQGTTNQSFMATENGSYAVIIDENGCIAQSECIEINTVGLAKEINSNWRIYPNPSIGKFYLTGLENNITDEVVRLEGKSIQKISLDKNQNEIDLTNYPQDIYILKLNDGSLFKLVKQ